MQKDVEKLKASAKNILTNECFEYFHSNNNRFVRFKVCTNFQGVIKFHGKRKILPLNATTKGTRVREIVLTALLKSDMHKMSFKASVESKFSAAEK